MQDKGGNLNKQGKAIFNIPVESGLWYQHWKWRREKRSWLNEEMFDTFDDDSEAKFDGQSWACEILALI